MVTWRRTAGVLLVFVITGAVAGCSNARGGVGGGLITSTAGQATPPTTTPSPVETRFADGRTTPVLSSPAGASENAATSFDWSDPNGYRFHLAVSFGTPRIDDPIASASTGCTGGDAPPGTTNIPFTLAITNLLPDRGSSLPMLDQDLAGLTPNPHPAGADAFISETDGSSCGNSLYGLAGRQQNANAVPAGSTVTLQGLIYAVPTPVAGTMTFSSVYNSSTTVASIPLPSS